MVGVIRLNENLEQQAQAIFKSWFIDFDPFGNQKPSDWSVSTLGNVSAMGAGGDKPQTVSQIKTDLCQYPIYSNGLSEEGLYGFTDKPKIFEESVTVSARGTIGFVCLRHIPYVPIVRLITLIPKTEIVSAKYLYLWLKQLHIAGTGTTQQQLTVPDFRKTEILVPVQEIMTLFTTTVEPIFKKIWTNQSENENLQQQAFAVFNNLIANAENNDYTVSDYAFLNPKRTLAKKQVARSIDMSQLSTSGSFPSGWEMKSFNGGMRFTNGDTLLARITPCLENGKTAFIDFLDDGEVAFGSTEYIVLTPKNDTPPEMLYCLARYPAFVDYAVKNMNGSSGRQRVSAETVGQYRLPLFDKHSLVLFKEVVAPMFLKMRYNSLENMRLTELRDALLPKLMSGEIDVSTVQL